MTNQFPNPLAIYPVVLGALATLNTVLVAEMAPIKGALIGLLVAACVECLVKTARHTAHLYSATVLTIMANMELEKEKQRFILMRDSYDQTPNEQPKT